jgi:nucleotide-binding universal stress UspA family protein
MLEVALRDTGRLVLICLMKASETIGRRVAVAWDGSVEASRAVALAMEFLVAAEEVVVISISEAGPFEPNAESLINLMQWHGVHARNLTLDGTAVSANGILLEKFDKVGADMLAMGAYTRDRFRRLIFGGVTGTALTQASVPVLMVD